MYIGDYYYIVSDDDIISIDMNTGETSDILMMNELDKFIIEEGKRQEETYAMSDKKYVAITVDDGPDGAGCEEYLSIARENDIKLTFFVVGENIASHASQINDITSLGCEIGNHSMTHAYLNEMSASEVTSEIEGCDKAIASVSPDIKVSFARAPYYAYSDTLKETIWYPLIESAVNEGDSDDEETTASNLLSLKDGDIMLMHCWNEGSKKALAEHVADMKADGYEFVTVSELFAIKGVTPENGVVYRNVVTE